MSKADPTMWDRFWSAGSSEDTRKQISAATPTMMSSSSSPSSSRKQVIYGRLVHSKTLSDLEILPKAAIGVDEKGCISFVDPNVSSVEAAVEKHRGFGEAARTTLKPLQFLFPGLIDTHLHAPQWPNLAIGMEGTLREWVENYTDPIEESYHDNKKAKRVYTELVQKELQLGTTTCAYNSTIHSDATNILADMCKALGQRAIIGKLSILVGSTHGNWEKSTEQGLADSQKSVDHIINMSNNADDIDADIVMPCIQPRGGPYCPPEYMAGLGKQSSGGDELIRVQGHMCETTEDMSRMKKIHPEFNNYSEMYHHYGLLHSRSILAHCIHLSKVDVDMLIKTKAGIAHNPNSNTCLRDGECRARDLLNAGVKIGLGTDCSAGYSTSMIDSMRQASNVSRHLAMHEKNDKLTLGFTEIVYLGTMGGAAVLDLQDKIGNFEPGKCFDALLVDVGLKDDLINTSGWEEDDLYVVKLRALLRFLLLTSTGYPA